MKHLKEKERRVLEAMAIPRKFTIEMIAEAADETEGIAKRVVREMRPVIVAGGLHEKIREVIRRIMGKHRRKELTERIIKWIEEKRKIAWIPEKYYLMSQINQEKAVREAEKEARELLSLAYLRIVEEIAVAVEVEEKEKAHLMILTAKALERRGALEKAIEIAEKMVE